MLPLSRFNSLSQQNPRYLTLSVFIFKLSVGQDVKRTSTESKMKGGKNPVKSRGVQRPSICLLFNSSRVYSRFWWMADLNSPRVHVSCSGRNCSQGNEWRSALRSLALLGRWRLRFPKFTQLKVWRGYLSWLEYKMSPIGSCVGTLGTQVPGALPRGYAIFRGWSLAGKSSYWGLVSRLCSLVPLLGLFQFPLCVWNVFSFLIPKPALQSRRTTPSPRRWAGALWNCKSE